MSNIRVALLLSFVIAACGSNSALTGLGTTSGGAVAAGGNQAAGGGSGGGDASGTAGMPNVSAICNGLLGEQRACGYESFDIGPSSDIDATAQSNCDFALVDPSLLGTSPDVSATVVALDCNLAPPMPDNSADAGVSGGFVIDSAQSPAHLRLIGDVCLFVQTPGTHHIDLVVRCTKTG